MGYRSRLRTCYFVLAISLLSVCQPVTGSQWTLLTQPSQDNSRHAPPRSNATSSRQTQQQQGKTRTKSEPVAKPGTAPGGLTEQNNPTLREDTKKSAMLLLELVLSGSDRITPVEYNILTRVEAATLLWPSDPDRATPMLKAAVELMRQLRDQEPANASSNKQRRLRFLAFLKIARLSPELVKDFALTSENGEKSDRTISGDWSDEARAIITIADEQINTQPQLAAQLAQQTFSFGQIDWATFLKKLSARDNQLGEQVAMTVISRLSSGSLTPIYLLNLQRFVMSPERSAKLKEYFLGALASRLRRDLSVPVSSADIEASVVAAEGALRITSSYPRWRAEFADIRSGLQEMLTARSVPIASTASRKLIPIENTNEVKPGDTQEIVDSLPNIASMPPSQASDLRYKEMAVKAAVSGNLRLAEEVLAKIENDALRRPTTLAVYGPFVRKAIKETDLMAAREFASKIADPLGRTLVLDEVARVKTIKDKQFVQETYGLATDKLRRDSPTEDVAKAYLILARQMSTIDPDGSLESLSWAIYILNKLTRNGELADNTRIDGALAWWVNLRSVFSFQDEALDLTELLGAIFTELARRDPNTAQMVGDGLLHQGLYSIAQLGVVRGMLLQRDLPAVRKPPPSDR